MLRIGVPSPEPLAMGMGAWTVAGDPAPQALAGMFWHRLASLGGERHLIRGDYTKPLGICVEVDGETCPAGAEYVDMGAEEGKKYGFWLFPPGFDVASGDWADARYGVTLGKPSVFGGGGYQTLVHAPDGTSPERLFAALRGFEEWLAG